MLWVLSLALALVPIAEPARGGSSEYSSFPIVASNGSTFAVAWNGETPHVAIYDETGHVLARVERLTEEQAFVSDITVTGRDYTLAYVTSNRLYRATIRDDGTVVSNEFVMPGWTAAVATIDSSMVMMNEGGMAMVIDAAGTIPVTIANAMTYSPHIAASRSKFFAVWLADEQAWGALFVPGSRRATSPVPIGPSDPVGLSSERPSIASDGDAFLVAWKAGSEIRVANIDPNGAVSLPRTIAIDATRAPSITWTGNDYVVVYPAAGAIVSVEISTNRTTRVPSEARFSSPRIASSAHASLIVRQEGVCYASRGIVASFAIFS